MSGSKNNSSGDVARTAKKFQKIMMETEVKITERVERQKEEEVTEEPKRFTTQEMARGIFFIEEALLVFET